MPEVAQDLLSRTGISEASLRSAQAVNFSWKLLQEPDLRLVTNHLGSCKDLEVIDLSHNKLGDKGVDALARSLPNACAKLRTINLMRNGITDAGLKALSSFLGNPKASAHIARIDLSLNALRDDAALGAALATNTGLVELDLSSNALRSGKAIAAALGTNRTLKRAHLLYNPLDVRSAGALAAAIRESRAAGLPLTLCNLEQEAEAIYLARRGMRSSDAMLLAAELESLPCVRTVDLSYNMLGPEAAYALAAALRASSTLTALKLQSNRLAGSWLDFGDEVGTRDDSGVVALASSLSEGNTLTSLDLSLNTLGEAGAAALASAVACAPEDDPLRWLRVGQSGGEALPVQPLRGLAVRGEVESAIVLSGQRLDDLDAVVIASLIGTNSRLLRLDLSGSMIGAIGSRALASALASPDCRLTQLDLRGKGMLGEEGKRAIGLALARPASAEVGCLACDHFVLGPNTAALDLPGAMLTPADVVLLAGVLHHNRALLSLDLSSNGLGPPACAALCSALGRNNALVELDVYGNELTDEGAKQISETLKLNSTLTTLSLGLNGLSGEGVRRVCHALEGNSSLVALSLENNGASTFTEVYANSLLDSNRRRAAVVRHMPGGRFDSTATASRLHVHLCGEPGSGRTALAGALRRSGVGQKSGEEPMTHMRTRGVVESTQRYESRIFVVTDYGGKSEFALMHHRHHDKNAREIMHPAVYVIVVNLLSGFEAGVEEIRWWRRYLRALMPRGTVPPVCLVGSRADRCAKPAQMLAALREHANFDGAELPEIVAAHAFDCRGAAWPLREWYVHQHDALVGAAPPLPRAIDLVLTRKEAWMEKQKLRSMGWSDFCARLRKEVREELGTADEHSMRAVTSYLHDMSVLLLAEAEGGAGRGLEPTVILDVPWFYSSIISDLLINDGRPPRSADGGGGAPGAAAREPAPGVASIAQQAMAMAAAHGGSLPPAPPPAPVEVAAAAPAARSRPVTPDGTAEEMEQPFGGGTEEEAQASLAMCNAAIAFASASADTAEWEAEAAAAEAGLTPEEIEAAMAPVEAALARVDEHGDYLPASVPTSTRGGGSGGPEAIPDTVSVAAQALMRAAGVRRPSIPAAGEEAAGEPTRELGAAAPQPDAPQPAAPQRPSYVPSAASWLPDASLSLSQLVARCRAAPAFGEDAGAKLAPILCELGLCSPVYPPGRPEQVGYLVAPLLTARESKDDDAQRAATALRGRLGVQAARRFIGRSADDMLLVPQLLPRLHVRASQEPAARDEPESRQVVRDSAGRLLLGRHGACCVLQLVELPDGRDAVDVFACARRPGALPYAMLNDALELLRLCVSECAPGVQPEHHVIGAAGLDDESPPERRPTAPIGVVRAACKAGKTHVHFGGANQSILQLLGDEEVRATLGPNAERAGKGSPAGGGERSGGGRPAQKNKYDIAGLASMAAKAEAAKEERALGKAPKPSPKGSALQPARKAASQGNKNRG